MKVRLSAKWKIPSLKTVLISPIWIFFYEKFCVWDVINNIQNEIYKLWLTFENIFGSRKTEFTYLKRGSKIESFTFFDLSARRRDI
jgi:hypothetical protein